MDNEELKAVLSRKKLIDFRAERAFKLMDKDKSNTLSKDEVKAHIKEEIDGELDEENFEKELKKWDNFDMTGYDYFNLEEFKLIYRQMVLEQFHVKKRTNNLVKRMSTEMIRDYRKTMLSGQ